MQLMWITGVSSYLSGTVAQAVGSDLLTGAAVVLVVALLVFGGGAAVSLLVVAVSSFLNHNMPPTSTSAAPRARFDARAGKKQTKQTEMVDQTNARGDVDVEGEGEGEGEVEEQGESGGAFDTLVKGSRYVALLAAWIATCGSLFMSEVLGWVPCLLCWYQRIFMYPLSLILAVGILRRDRGIYKYALVLSIPGASISLIHYLDQKTTLLRGMINCVVGVPCSADYLNWLGGVVTIPFLALIAFLIITFCMVATRLDDVGEEEAVTGSEKAPRPSRVLHALPVFAIIAAVVIAFVVAGVLVKNNVAAAAPTSSAITATLAPLPTADATSVARGKLLYDQSCAVCHGLNGEGTSAGRPLTNSDLVKTSSTADLVKFVRVGRSANDPHNTTGLNMPASGGQPNYSDADIAAVIAYIRQLAGVNPLGK